MTNKDTLFKEDKIKRFKFNKEVVNVFDDMISRSIPLYQTIQDQIVALYEQNKFNINSIYDLGCSTGTTLYLLSKSTKKSDSLYGIDYSENMLEKAKEKCTNIKTPINFENIDLNNTSELSLKKPTFVIINLCLQFLNPENRKPLLNHIYKNLPKKGTLVLIEKIKCSNSQIEKIFREEYENLKRLNGYSESEIINKKKALRKVLIPYTLDENILLLKNAGFTYTEIFFKWFNFVGIVAIK